MILELIKSLAWGTVAIAVAAVLAWLILLRNSPSQATAEERSEAPVTPGGPLRQGSEVKVRITPAERQALGIETSAAQSSSRPEQIRMSATTALDSDTLAYVHPRFAGEATEVKVRLGQHVNRGDPLAIVWSKDLGEKKSEYSDARSQLKLNQDVLDKLQGPYGTGAIPERTYLQAVRDVESSRIALDRAFRTLIAWRLKKEEIENIDRANADQWPREVVTAPISGDIVEKNLVPGVLIDPTMTLFQVADLSHIAIRAYAFEEDLARVRPGQTWSVTLQAVPGTTLTGPVSVVGAVVDPTQHTATVQGTVANPGGRLKAGMFATAVISLPPETDQVVVPSSALVDVEDRTVVYVQSSRQPDEFVRREVSVKERLQDEAYLSGGVQPGDNVVSQGTLELDQKAMAGSGRAEE